MHRRLVFALVLLSMLVAAPEAAARIDGDCQARIADQDVTSKETGAFSDAIVVDRNDLAAVSMSADQPIQRLKVELEFAGVRWAVHDRPTTGTTWSSEVPVENYNQYGIGLYKVVGTSIGAGFTCEAAALISVEGEELDPLVTVAGAIGLALAIIGLFGLLAIALRVGHGRSAQVLLGVFLGAMLGVGIGVLLQQFSVVYPTVPISIAIVGAGVIFGFLLSVVGLRTTPMA
jgi:hypothetical protein